MLWLSNFGGSSPARRCVRDVKCSRIILTLEITFGIVFLRLFSGYVEALGPQRLYITLPASMFSTQSRPPRTAGGGLFPRAKTAQRSRRGRACEAREAGIS